MVSEDTQCLSIVPGSRDVSITLILRRLLNIDNGFFKKERVKRLDGIQKEIKFLFLVLRIDGVQTVFRQIRTLVIYSSTEKCD